MQLCNGPEVTGALGLLLTFCSCSWRVTHPLTELVSDFYRPCSFAAFTKQNKQKIRNENVVCWDGGVRWRRLPERCKLVGGACYCLLLGKWPSGQQCSPAELHICTVWIQQNMGLRGHEQVLALIVTVLVVTASAIIQLYVKKLELPSVIRSLFTGIQRDEVRDSDVVTIVTLYYVLSRCFL